MMETIEAGSAEALRAGRGLRQLNKDEEGSRVADLAAGVYGFTWSPAFESTPLFAKKSFRNFEFHKLSGGGIELVGYVTADDATRLKSGAGQIEVYPDPWEQAKQLVSVPLDRIVPSKRVPARENGCPWLVELR